MPLSKHLSAWVPLELPFVTLSLLFILMRSTQRIKKYHFQLFVAVIMDDSVHGLILCYAIAPIESKDKWTWFLRFLFKEIDNVDDPSIPLIFDRQKGLIVVVHEVFLNAVHGNCAHHLHANVKSNHWKAIEKFFGACSRCSKVCRIFEVSLFEALLCMFKASWKNSIPCFISFFVPFVTA